jgi:hypothetical protein
MQEQSETSTTGVPKTDARTMGDVDEGSTDNRRMNNRRHQEQEYSRTAH